MDVSCTIFEVALYRNYIGGGQTVYGIWWLSAIFSYIKNEKISVVMGFHAIVVISAKILRSTFSRQHGGSCAVVSEAIYFNDQMSLAFNSGQENSDNYWETLSNHLLTVGEILDGKNRFLNTIIL